MAHLPAAASRDGYPWGIACHIGCVLLLLVLCPSLSSAAPGCETGAPISGDAKTAFLQTWSEHLQTMRSLHMTFTQEKHLRFLRRPLITQGELWLAGETLRYVSKNTAGDIELESRFDRQTIKIHYPLLQTLEVMSTQGSQGLPRSIPFLGRDATTLNKEYEVTLCESSGRQVLQLVPRAPHGSTSEIRLTLKNFQPQEFIQIEKNGSRLVMHITAFTLNPDISAAQLDLQIPPGTRVIHPLTSHPPEENRPGLKTPNTDIQNRRP